MEVVARAPFMAVETNITDIKKADVTDLSYSFVYNISP